MDDRELLSAYLSNASPDAFAQIVRQNIDLVYSAARRQLGDSHLADDVTQAVFVLLSHKAASVKGPLAGWLLTATRFASRDARKIAARREYHERQAALMRPEQSLASDEPPWETYAPILDDAIARLKPSDRDAVALRYFRGLSLEQVGVALGINAKTAEKRVARAIGRLRQTLAIKTSVPAVAVLASQLAARGSVAAPAKLIESIILTGPSIVKGTLISALARKAGQAMYWTKAKIAAMVIASVTVAGAGTGTYLTLAAGTNPIVTPPAITSPALLPAAPALQAAEPGPTVQSTPPVVVKTEPQAGVTNVDPATTEIRVTFSKAMRDGDWSWVQISDQTFPKINGKIKYLDDHKTCVMPVQLQAGKTYVIWLNQPQFQNFQDTDGHRAIPYLLVFQTSP
jgi:RNA polymerase sigma factor (sigma-70 family)